LGTHLPKVYEWGIARGPRGKKSGKWKGVNSQRRHPIEMWKKEEKFMKKNPGNLTQRLAQVGRNKHSRKKKTLRGDGVGGNQKYGSVVQKKGRAEYVPSAEVVKLRGGGKDSMSDNQAQRTLRMGGWRNV